jgi:protocatechuate 3,4-dioxygenase beta subunit
MIRKICFILSALGMFAFTANAATVSGVVDTGGVGLAGVVVTLTPIGGGTAMVDTTIANGDYSIAAVAQGFYNITADLAGYAPYAGFINAPAGNGVVARNITLTVLPPGITISGTVTDSVGGTPLVGAKVLLRTIGGGATTVDSTVAAANGTYSLTHVQAGTYNLIASAAGHTSKTVRTVVAAANITSNFQLVGLPAGIVISGTVTDSVSGNALAGAKVYLRTGGVGGGTLLDSAVTSGTGTYSIDSVLPGNYRLVASAAGHTTRTTMGVVVAAAPVTQNFQLVGLPAGIIISGTVTDSVNGTPLAGAKVYLRTGGGGGTLLDSATAAANGTYSIDSVDPGTYRLVASAGGHTTKTVTGVVVAAAPVTQNFQLVGLPAGIIISGTVTDSVSGSPLAGAKVYLRTGGFPVTVVDSATSAANGTYAIDSVDAGTYSLNATAGGHIAKTVNAVVVAAAPVTQNFQLVGLPAGIRISGTVTDSVRGTPLAGAKVYLRTGGGGGGTLLDSATAAANGTYSIDSVQPGTYRLVASAAGHTTKTVNGVVAAAAPVTQNFQLVGLPGVDISGNVADSSSGMPLSGAVVRLLQGVVLVDSAIVAANGTYALTSVPPGTYSLSASAAGHATKTLTGVVVANASITQNFLLVIGVGIVSGKNNSVFGKPEFSLTAARILQLRNFSDQGLVSVFSVSGKLVYRTGIAANASAVVLPKAMVGGTYLVSVTQKNTVYRKQIVMP